jgi:hypothetical protein
LASANGAQSSAGVLHTQQETGLFRHFAHGGQRKAASERRARLGDALQQFCLRVGVQLGDRLHVAILRFDTPARKHKLARHEFVTGMAAAHQHLRLRTGAVDQHDGGGIARLAVRE